MSALRSRGLAEPGLMQAALLHDCAKSPGGVRLWHRVLMVLVKAVRPDFVRGLAAAASPPSRHWSYPLWAHANHARRGAAWARSAGCNPLAVRLIMQHQTPPAEGMDPDESRLLLALQTADDEN
jgi:hypothetical protein